MPFVGQFFLRRRKIQDYVSIAVSDRSMPEAVELRRGFGIEISTRHLGVTISSAGDELANVSAIFAEQCFAVIFGMALQVNRETPPLADEHIGANLGRLRHDAIAPGLE